MVGTVLDNLLWWKEISKTINNNGSQTSGKNLVDEGIWKELLWENSYISFYNNQRMNAYKLFMLDVGLLGALSELPATSILEGNDIFIEFKGLSQSNMYCSSWFQIRRTHHIIMELRKLRFSTLKYMDQEWMVNIPLYAICNL